MVADPLRERVSLQFARALHLVGRTAEAIRALESSGVGRSMIPGWIRVRLADLQRRVLADDATLRPRRPARSPAAARPRHADRFVGRSAELAGLGSAVAANRLVTIVGPGGVGKTRLAAEFLGRLDDPPPVFRCDLGDVSAPRDVGPAAAAAVGLRAAAGGSRRRSRTPSAQRRHCCSWTTASTSWARPTI